MTDIMKYFKHTYIYLSVAVLLSSCSNFLKEYSQDTDYIDSWKDLNETLIGDCYMTNFATRSISESSDLQYFIHFLGDELAECTDSYNNYSMAYDDKEK